MSKLAQPLRKMVEPGQNFKAWYVYPRPGGRKPSVMYMYATDTVVPINDCLRRHLEKMAKRLAEDRRAGGDSQYYGAYADDEWAEIFGCKRCTVVKYRRRIDKLFLDAGLDAYKEIFEEVIDDGWWGVRIRPEVIFVRPKAAVQVRRRTRRVVAH